jgi:hypothetical protein
MSDSTFRYSVIGAAAVLYAGLVGYSVLGFGGGATGVQDGTRATVPPRVMYHDSDIDVYGRRSVRTSGPRGGGIRGGK